VNIRQFIESTVLRTEAKTYLLFEDQAWTYRQFDDRVNQAANGFMELGIRKGDRVCLMLPNCPEFLFAWLGLNKIGGIMVPINTFFKVPETRYIVDHCGAKGMITSPETLEVVLSVREKGSTLKWVGVIGRGPKEKAIELLPLWDRSPHLLEDISLEEQDTASIIYTSGTTGPPKGVVHTHRSYVLCGQAMTVRAQLSSEDRLMIILPLFHANAQFYSTMGSIAAEACLILTPRFSATQFWKQARRYGATQFNFIGAIGRILVARPIEEFDPAHSIRVANGGPVPADVYHALTERFEIPHVIDGYGLTECPGVCQNPIDGVKKVGSMGLPAKHPDPSIQFTEMKVVDDGDSELPPGRIGELVVRSPVLMKGYFKDPEQTSEAMRGGWFHTGDDCYRDEEGYFFFVDRKKDIIRRKGENISSVEVERVINAHPQVSESAVVAVPSSLSEDEVKAFVVLKGVFPPEEMIDWCMERLADFKVPRYIEFRKSLPKTPSERIAKYLLKEDRGGAGIDMSEYIQKTIRKRDKMR
jgi:carnitine-CoA ligase